jgi:hypothetical protein
MQSTTASHPDLPIACDPSSITPQEMDRWMNVILPELYGKVQEISELPDGWSLRLPVIPELLMIVAEDMDIERRCCPFVHYTLEIPPGYAPFSLNMTGGEGVKEFLKMAYESAPYFDAAVAQAAGLNVAARPLDSADSVLEAVDQLNDRYAQSAS